jgi:hypothetical protein
MLLQMRLTRVLLLINLLQQQQQQQQREQSRKVNEFNFNPAIIPVVVVRMLVQPLALASLLFVRCCCCGEMERNGMGLRDGKDQLAKLVWLARSVSWLSAAAAAAAKAHGGAIPT